MKRVFIALGKISHHFTIHSKFLKKLVNTRPTNFFNTRSKNVYLHGDFTLQIILYHPKSGRIALVDWSTPPFLSFQTNWGPQLWDINVMISTIFHYSPFTILFSFGKRKKNAFAFLEGSHSDVDQDKKLHMAELDHFIRNFNLYAINPKNKRGFVARYSHLMLMRFVRELRKS